MNDEETSEIVPYAVYIDDVLHVAVLVEGGYIAWENDILPNLEFVEVDTDSEDVEINPLFPVDKESVPTFVHSLRLIADEMERVHNSGG